MIVPEVDRLLEDLRRATTFNVTPETAEAVLDRVTDAICKVIEEVERSRQGYSYRSIYNAPQQGAMHD